jgi:small subunit ribosomal protein S20
LPILESVKRELRTATKKQERNRSTRTLTKSALKKAEKTIAAGDAEASKADTTGAISNLDKASSKRILHRNNVARHKSRLMKKLNKLQAAAKPEAEKKK